ncbi:MAG: hypothetical protein HY712_05590 [candidate division NC10 bacterium]|nr:hypothetical protein [candidate division NC10 bacterium]
MMSISGKWRIIEMDAWDREAIELVGPGFIEFHGQGGQFHFIAVDGWMNCRHGQRSGKPYVDFTWEGNDECDPASGRGWVKLLTDGSLTGHIYFHHGDDSGFKAIPYQEDEKGRSKVSSTTKRGLR